MGWLEPSFLSSCVAGSVFIEDSHLQSACLGKQSLSQSLGLQKKKETQLSSLLYTPSSFSSLLAPCSRCLFHHDSETAHKYTSDFLSARHNDSQHFSLSNTSQHLTLSAFLKFSLDPYRLLLFINIHIIVQGI